MLCFETRTIAHHHTRHPASVRPRPPASSVSAMLSDGTPRPALPIARVQKPLTQLTKLASSRMHTESIPHPRCAIRFSCLISQRLDQEDLEGKVNLYLACPAMPCHILVTQSRYIVHKCLDKRLCVNYNSPKIVATSLHGRRAEAWQKFQIVFASDRIPLRACERWQVADVRRRASKRAGQESGR